MKVFLFIVALLLLSRRSSPAPAPSAPSTATAPAPANLGVWENGATDQEEVYTPPAPHPSQPPAPTSAPNVINQSSLVRDANGLIHPRLISPPPGMPGSYSANTYGLQSTSSNGGRRWLFVSIRDQANGVRNGDAFIAVSSTSSLLFPDQMDTYQTLTPADIANLRFEGVAIP